ncbi:fumarylacetoacetate hydrolase family protein [Georgenia yuyongxinii]|uniref:Fumarylacetoacetate hydrolase family protein n=1 Tax=Georgenia yuyongxinii TaxID=2589797 RepID=A0A552WTN3_9MICO|nr:fumarylacetoacetate hydrolase family protein [Georgenia yuyongxinii]TRW45683.1 fumarylacetoacetate hydrolase family protein [Georgenia yuyongxinii]
MRIANLNDRAVLLDGDRALDVERASDGRFPADPQRVYDDWEAFRAWAERADLSAAEPFDPAELGPPVPTPRQIFAIGLNYRDHAEEASLPHPEHLVVFTKFQSSLAGPHAQVPVPGDTVDYETELVIVLGRGGRDIDEADAWDHVAGLSVGQDISERTIQRRGPAAQFSLGKSYPNFAPFGPAVVSVDELADKNALTIRAELDGNGTGGPMTLQEGNTRDMIFSVPQTIAQLSEVVTLLPGDIIFTGTPAGVGMSKNLFLRPGHVLTSEIEGIGRLVNSFV